MARRHLDDYTPDELNELELDELLALRRTAYRAHVEAMAVPDTLKSWASLMTKRYGPKVKIFRNTLPWLEALMVCRYGEAISGIDPQTEGEHRVFWPDAFSQEDIDRAWSWAKGKRTGKQRGRAPHGLTYLDLEDSGYAKVQALLAAVVLFLMVHGLAILAAALGVVLSLALPHGIGALIGGPIVIGSALTNYWENELIDHLFRSRSYSAPTAMHIALFTAAPGETGGGTEVTGGSYARVSAGVGATVWEGTGGETTATDSAGTGGGTQNIAAITFPAPTANWGSCTHFAGLDASTAGNMYFYGTLTTAKTVNNGDAAPSFAAGALDFALA